MARFKDLEYSGKKKMNKSRPFQTRATEHYKLNSRVNNLRRAILRELHADIRYREGGEILSYTYNTFHKKNVNIDLAGRYIQLREDVKKFAENPDFDNLVPSIWYFPSINLRFAAFYITFALLFAIPFVLWIMAPSIESRVLTLALYIPIIVMILFFVLIGGGYKRILASNIGEVLSKCELLGEYLAELDIPNVKDLQRSVEYYRNLYLEGNEYLQAEVMQLKNENKQLTEKLVGQEATLEFKVDSLILDKLDSLERIRLTEAVMAYKIQSWTPAAAVCGMILEGRLQRLCRENNIPLGGFSDMIQRLGEAGLLKGHHQSLAKVGQFFRHRSAHPTTEEFNREKTTLVVTTLLILIREAF